MPFCVSRSPSLLNNRGIRPTHSYQCIQAGSQRLRLCRTFKPPQWHRYLRSRPRSIPSTAQPPQSRRCSLRTRKRSAKNQRRSQVDMRTQSSSRHTHCDLGRTTRAQLLAFKDEPSPPSPSQSQPLTSRQVAVASSTLSSRTHCIIPSKRQLDKKNGDAGCLQLLKQWYNHQNYDISAIRNPRSDRTLLHLSVEFSLLDTVCAPVNMINTACCSELDDEYM